ncbi:hypothetical protein [Saccharibacillus sp. O23]|uniref:hypothetical protein n=1 Tax=Saccharibacillus sp. O23 TaxID=2009338 RepID=UPI00117A09B1|nr:hypothetical protein [Saccharibacillus sp. O23]
MSEFTSGNLILNRNLEAVEAFRPTKVKTLNDEWSVFFTSRTENRFEEPNEVLDAKSDVPVMRFDNAEDHGWEFAIVKSGKVLSRFGFLYEQETMDLVELVERLDPDADPFEDLFMNEESDQYRAEMLEKLYAEKSKQARLEELFADFDLNAFAEFGISAEQSAELERLFRPETFAEEDSVFEHVERFKKILGIEEMSWVSSRYEDLDDEDQVR